MPIEINAWSVRNLSTDHSRLSNDICVLISGTCENVILHHKSNLADVIKAFEDGEVA